MSIHDEMDALADLYAGGGLDPGERLEVEQHAASCGACAAVLRDARDFASWLGGVLAPDAPPDGLEDRIVGRLRKGGSRTKGLSRFLPGAGLLKAVGSIAAALLLIVIGYMFVERTEKCVFRQEGDGKSISQLLFGLEGRKYRDSPDQVDPADCP